MPVTTENTLEKIGNVVHDILNILSLHTVVFNNKIPKVTFVPLKRCRGLLTQMALVEP